MMLFVENLEKGGELELAMLLDESPSPRYGDAATARLEPWAPGGALASGALSARAIGRAVLYLVFQSDARSAWGARTVNAVAGGLLCADARPHAPLRYEVVARYLFRNIVGTDSALPYRVLLDAALSPDPEQHAGILAPSRVHALLGYPVPPCDAPAAGPRDTPRAEANSLGDTPSLGTGARLTWVDNTGYSEEWFIADDHGAAEFHFGACELARRRYVQAILAILGFVDGAGTAPREVMARAVVAGMLPQLTALERLLCATPVTAAAAVSTPATPGASSEDGARTPAQPQSLSGTPPAGARPSLVKYQPSLQAAPSTRAQPSGAAPGAASKREASKLLSRSNVPRRPVHGARNGLGAGISASSQRPGPGHQRPRPYSREAGGPALKKTAPDMTRAPARELDVIELSD